MVVEPVFWGLINTADAVLQVEQLIVKKCELMKGSVENEVNDCCGVYMTVNGKNRCFH